MTSTSAPCAASSAAFTASLFSVAVSPTQTNPIPQVQARRLGGVGGAAICPVHIGKAHDERPLGEHLDPKGRPADGYAGRVITTVRMVLTGSQPPKASVVW